MTTEIRVPQLPESVADATLVAWHKQPGEAIRRDENLADLETDKVVLEVPAPANGVVRELRVQSGTVVTSGQVLAVIEEGAVAPAAKPVVAPAVPTAAAATAPAAAAPAARATATGDGEGARESAKLSPSVRRLVEENQLNPGAIPASGRDGRLTKADVVGFMEKKAAPA
ncbi:MAG: biotin/lipoyl-containing protein, partial [Steroidobacteraceae bacterium]